MSFQIVDDILDYRGDQSVIGKPIGGDLRQGLIYTSISLLHGNESSEYPS